MLPSEEAEELLNKYRASKKVRNIRAFKGTRPRDVRYCVTLSGKVEEIGNGDSDADYSALPRRTGDKIREAGIEASEDKLDEPMQLAPVLILPQELPFTSSGSVQLDIRISLPCGPLRPRNVELLLRIKI